MMVAVPDALRALFVDILIGHRETLENQQFERPALQEIIVTTPNVRSLPSQRDRAVWPLRVARFSVVFVALVFLFPALATAGWWMTVDRPASWRQADWSASGILPSATASDEAAIHVLAARTGGLKGAFATHSWIVIEEEGSDRYRRYDKVGWGRPVRIDAYPADANWYSNTPFIVGSVRGDKAADLIPRVEAAIASYPHNGRTRDTGYRIFPGPNSNTFVAHVLREVPALGLVLPPNAVGRDYLSGDRFFAVASDGRDIHASIFGLFGFSAGIRSGIEFHLMGLVAGFDIARPGIKVPALGLVTPYAHEPL